jgi:hypothetical protein
MATHDGIQARKGSEAGFRQQTLYEITSRFPVIYIMSIDRNHSLFCHEAADVIALSDQDQSPPFSPLPAPVPSYHVMAFPSNSICFVSPSSSKAQSYFNKRCESAILISFEAKTTIC